MHQLARHREISAAKLWHKNLYTTFLHIPSSLDKAILLKPMMIQGGSFCTSNLSSNTALSQDFVICNVSKYSMINILASFHSKSYLLFAVIMSVINPADRRSIQARLIPDVRFCAAVCELVESERDIKRIEANFSITRDYALNKRYYCVHYVLRMDPGNTKDFFKRIWD